MMEAVRTVGRRAHERGSSPEHEPSSCVRCAIVPDFDNGNVNLMKRVEIMPFDGPIEDQMSEYVGLSLAEGKALLNWVQRKFVIKQIELFARRVDLAMLYAICSIGICIAIDA